MDIASRIARYQDKDFSRERAEINVLIESAAFSIFKDFPDAFVLFGGATLVLYHDSVRHSADLDLLSRGIETPSRQEIVASRERELTPLSAIIETGTLQFGTDSSENLEGRIFVTTDSNRRLFRVDLSRLGSAIESEIEDHRIDAETGISAFVKWATKELLLLQKAEAFLLRRAVKARDAYDVHLLQSLGSMLSAKLRPHLQDTILANEIDSDAICNRIDRVDKNLCRVELKPILPTEIYAALEAAEFETLREALRRLYGEWR